MKKLLLLLLISNIANAATYYTDPSAAGGGDGSSSTPWNSAAGFNGASFSAGDDHYLYCGRHLTTSGTKVENSTFDGTSSNPAVFGCYYTGSGGSPTVGLNRQAVTALSCSSGTVSVTAAGSHYYTNGDYIRVLDADQPEYNVSDAVVTVVDADEFQYTISSCATETTGTGNIVTEFEPPWIEAVSAWGDHSWRDDVTTSGDFPWVGTGATSNANLLTANCDDTAGTADNPDTSQAGLVEFDTSGTDYITIQNIGIRNTCGRGLGMTNVSGTDREGFIIDNIYIENTMLACMHMRRTKYTVTNSWFTGCGQGQQYFGYYGGGTAAIGYRGEETDPNRCIDGSMRGNVIWDSGGWEGFSIVRGTACHSVTDNIFIDAGELTQLYLTSTQKIYIGRNFFAGTTRAPYDDTPNSSGGIIGDGASIFMDDEYSFGYDCSTAPGLQEYKDVRNQDIGAEQNIFIGDDYTLHWRSKASWSGTTQCGGSECLCDGHDWSIEGYSDRVYFDNNLGLDPTGSFFRFYQGSHQDGSGDYDDFWWADMSAANKPRLKASIFASPGTSPSTTYILTDANSTFETDSADVFDFLYIDSSLTGISAFNSNVITSGLQFELSSYYDLDTLMNVGSDDHATYPQMRYFIRTVLNLDPDDLTARDYTSLAKFLPIGTAGWGSKITDMPRLETFTVPSGIDGDAPAGVAITDKDIRELNLSDPPDVGAFLIDRHAYVRSVNTATDGTVLDTTVPFDYPDDCAAGDTMLTFITTGGTTTFSTVPTGYTQIANASAGGMATWVYWYKYLGTEGSTENWVLNAINRLIAQNLCIDGAISSDITSPTASSVASGTDNQPDPPAAAGGLGNIPRLTIAFVSYDEDTSARPLTDWPDETTIFRSELGEVTTNTRRQALAINVSKTEALNPGVFTFETADQWLATTIQVAADGTTTRARRIRGKGKNK